MPLITKTLMRQLITMFMAGALIPIALITLLSVNYSGKALETSAFEKLDAIRVIKTNQIKGYIAERLGDLEVLSALSDTKNAFDKLKAYHDSGGGDPNGNFDIGSEQYQEIYKSIDPFFRRYLESYGYYDIFFICAKHGHVMYSVAREADLGENLSRGQYKDSGLGRLWQKVLRNRKATMVDFSLYAPSNNEPATFIGTPVVDGQGDIIAVLALQISTKQIDKIMQEKTGMGESGETYLVGEDFLMRSDSRFSKESTILNKDYTIRTEAVEEGLADKSGSKIIDDYRGIKVLSSYSHFGLNEVYGFDFEWVVVSEIDKEEAYRPVTLLAKKIIVIGGALLLLAILLGYFSSRSISRPLTNLAEKISQVAKGDLTVEIAEDNRKNEVGILVRAARTMVKSLQEQTHGLINSAESIATSINELSATATQLAASSIEASSTIAEVTSTVEEVRQTAHVSNEKAEDVTRGASAMNDAAAKGQQSTDDSRAGMQVIKEEMSYVADSIIKLSEQTQSIGEIISAVNDLTDQSNLLSVNAAIEAAKAGEYGKGFAVVAQEVKSLAEQSKEATSQVKTILNDIQKATSTAVLATERGKKAVENGEKLSVESGTSIAFLASQVNESSHSASQILASNQQQLGGMDQLAAAMENIKESTAQNTDGAKQLEDATNNLKDLAETLKQLAGQFKV